MRLLLVFLLAALSLRAEVSLAPLFKDHVVLQRDKPLPVWGIAAPKERVTVQFHGQSVSCKTDSKGRWMVYLDPVPASAKPEELVVTGKNSIRVTDVLVGDVWLCSGQSNMEWPVRLTMNASAEIAAANLPLIRHFKVERAVADSPDDDAKGMWVICSPSTAGDFTAVGFYFARDLQPRLQVPIGIINSSWGGTPVESWMSPAALSSDPAFSVVAEGWKKALADYPQNKIAYEAALANWKAEEAEAKAKGKEFKKQRPWEPSGVGSPWTPSGLFNGMINPLTPYALRGALWYQGESNAPKASAYHKLFKTMVTTWRGHFGQQDLPFLWVQLANYEVKEDETGRTWAFLREAQSQTLELPNTGQAITVDIGTPDNIHPANKQEVGRRLALIARAKVYGTPLDYTGPVFSDAARDGARMRVRFSNAGTGLTASGGPLDSFEVAGGDKVFFPAVATIEGDCVMVEAREVNEPVAVRYAWTNCPEANLYNGAGLPAAPFRSDEW